MNILFLKTTRFNKKISEASDGFSLSIKIGWRKELFEI